MPILVILAALLFLSLLFKSGSETTQAMSRQDRKRHEKILEHLETLRQTPRNAASFTQVKSSIGKLNAPESTLQSLYDRSLDLVEHHRHHEEGRSIAKRITRSIGRRMERSEEQITGDISDRL